MSIAQFFEANAGTGKTNRLTEAIVNTSVPMDKVCAVTYTEKAANEMIDRLRQKMSEEVMKGNKKPGDTDKINDCFIGTIHGFCAQLLKRYGEQIGLPPLFQVDADEAPYFQELFTLRWNSFLSDVLKNATSPYDRLIDVPGIENLRSLAVLLSSRRYNFKRPDDADISWLMSSLRDPLTWGFNAKHKWTKLALHALSSSEENRDVLLMMAEVKKPEITAWKNAISDALNCRTDELYTAIDALKRDFVDRLLREYRTLGYMRYDDLIIDARNILRDHLHVRKQLKERYELVLVDEMQDTDPVQYEIFLYLCEQKGREEKFTLQELISGKKRLRLQEGKLFVVGDPKQSIYGFRRADLNAYERIKEVFSSQVVEIQQLDQNRRSCPNIVDFTNKLAAKLFVSNPPKDSVAHRQELCAGKSLTDCVQIINVDCAEANVVHLRVLTEANWLAERIQELHSEGIPYKDVGILLRKLTNAHLYIDSLSSRDVPVVVEGEKYFFQSQEVIDFLNLLKFILDSMDTLALAGLLRSPLFGLYDFELAAFFQQYGRNYDPLASLDSALAQRPAALRETIAGFVNKIFLIRRDLHTLTPGRFVDRVLKDFPILTIASLAYGNYRSQLAPLNILKIHKEALAADADPLMTPYRFVKTFEAFSKDAKESPQESVADEGTDAVRVLSIHRAKGLDFPIVFVPLTDYAGTGWRDRLEVIHDWETDQAGIRLGTITEAKYLRLKYGNGDAAREESEELERISPEERRVLYVAATRAKKQLFFCYVPNPERRDNALGNEIFVFLSDLDDRVPVSRDTSVPWFTTTESEKTGQKDIEPVLAEWKSIEAAAGLNSLPVIRSITIEAREGVESEEFQMMKSPAGAHAALVGSICHAALEKIDYRNPGEMGALVNSVSWKFSSRFTKDSIAQASKESVAILEKFLRSDPARWLASVEILAREFPIQTYDSKNGKILTGTIDLFLREGEHYFLLDYKSNTELDRNSLEIYRNQMHLYIQALAHSGPSDGHIQARLCMLRSCELIDL